jgi:heme A synthase
MMKLTGFAKYAWFVLMFNIGVIIWGAYVRATGSGAGCGNHWPLCDGVVIPRAESINTVIEFTHRLSSGVAFLLVIGLLIWAIRIYPSRSNVRSAAILSMVFMITEALIGAGLVLFELVAQDTSTARAFAISIHLVNTFLLLACITLTAWWASGGEPVKLHGNDKAVWLLGAGIFAMLILGMSGALTALGDTLFPISSLAEGIRQDFSPSAHFLVRLRIFHPSIAVLVSIYLVITIGWLVWKGVDSTQKIIGRLLTFFLLIQLLAGLINVILLAPVWLQLVHLLLADVAWIMLVLFTARALSFSEEVQEGATDTTKILSKDGSIP